MFFRIYSSWPSCVEYLFSVWHVRHPASGIQSYMCVSIEGNKDDYQLEILHLVCKVETTLCLCISARPRKKRQNFCLQNDHHNASFAPERKDNWCQHDCRHTREWNYLITSLRVWIINIIQGRLLTAVGALIRKIAYRTVPEVSQNTNQQELHVQKRAVRRNLKESLSAADQWIRTVLGKGLRSSDSRELKIFSICYG